MKNIKRGGALSIILLMTFLVPWTLGAQEGPLNINPETLRVQILDKNIAILKELNQVYQTKLQMNLARSQLLPSLNLGVAVNPNGPNFFISTVSFLLPFLLPSNWFNYTASEYTFEAEQAAYYLIELNLYSSAYSAYSTMLGDRELREVLRVQYENLKKIQDAIQVKVYLGLASETDLIQAQAQVQLALVQLSQMDELLQKEKAALREVLALPIDQDFTLETSHVSASPLEGQDYKTVLEKAYLNSPEYKQIQSLIGAADHGNWSKVFAFLTNGTLSAFGNPGQSVSFSNLMQTTSFTFGFGYFPAVQISAAAVEQLELRKQEIKFEQGQIVEGSLSGIAQAKTQLQQAQQAEEKLNQVFQIQLQNYNLGFTDLLHVLDAQNSVTVASTARVKSQVDLDNLRINLLRLTVDDQFKNIHGCQLEVKDSGSWWDGIKEFFSGKASEKSLDELCRESK